jgi:hypothetical protein
VPFQGLRECRWLQCSRSQQGALIADAGHQDGTQARHQPPTVHAWVGGGRMGCPCREEGNGAGPRDTGLRHLAGSGSSLLAQPPCLIRSQRCVCSQHHLHTRRSLRTFGGPLIVMVRSEQVLKRTLKASATPARTTRPYFCPSRVRVRGQERTAAGEEGGGKRSSSRTSCNTRRRQAAASPGKEGPTLITAREGECMGMRPLITLLACPTAGVLPQLTLPDSLGLLLIMRAQEGAAYSAQHHKQGRTPGKEGMEHTERGERC